MDISKNNKKEPDITRRAFFKRAACVTGGLALASVALGSGCTTEEDPTTPPGNTTPQPTTPAPTTPPGNTTPQPTTTPGNGEFVYVPPSHNPEMIMVPGCVSGAATDRLYSEDHVWVKLLDNNQAVLGITDKMQLLIGFTGSLDGIYLLDPGTQVTRDGLLSNLEGMKMNADIYAPLSGNIKQTNTALKTRSLHLVTEPYLRGWLYVMEYTNPEELDHLWTAEEYAEANANPDWDFQTK